MYIALTSNIFAFHLCHFMPESQEDHDRLSLLLVLKEVRRRWGGGVCTAVSRLSSQESGHSQLITQKQRVKKKY